MSDSTHRTIELRKLTVALVMAMLVDMDDFVHTVSWLVIDCTAGGGRKIECEY